MNKKDTNKGSFVDVVIVGAGASGIGVGVVLKSLGLPFVILEKDSVGSTFKKWPKEMRFISPSFTSNFFGQVDLNAITPDTSPAFTLQTEHPSGKEYARYLEGIVDHFELPIQTGYTVKKIMKENDKFIIKTNKEVIQAKYVIWAAGEFQYPNTKPFDGAEYCIHNSLIGSWKNLSGNKFVVVGAYESGMDAAIQLAKLNKKVVVLDAQDQMNNIESDSSYSLSPYTRSQYRLYKRNITIIKNSKVLSVSKKKDYHIKTKNHTINSKTQPILATGFKTSLTLVNDLFDFKDGVIQLTEDDESTKNKGLFLVGPQVQHNNAVFCFIYKYRQRFPIVAETIAKRVGIKRDVIEEMIEYYKEMNFYLKDLSCCGNECVC